MLPEPPEVHVAVVVRSFGGRSSRPNACPAPRSSSSGPCSPRESFWNRFDKDQGVVNYLYKFVNELYCIYNFQHQSKHECDWVFNHDS